MDDIDASDKFALVYCRHPYSTRVEISDASSGNICCYAGYKKIVDAVAEAASPGLI